MDDIEGQVITTIRQLAGDISDGLAWTVTVDEATVALELGDGSLLIPVSNPEGNEPGVFLEKGVDAWDNLAGSLITDLTPMSQAAMKYRDWDSSGYRLPALTVDTGEQLYRQQIRKAIIAVSSSGCKTGKHLLLSSSQ